jgi:hypothetical protein
VSITTPVYPGYYPGDWALGDVTPATDDTRITGAGLLYACIDHRRCRLSMNLLVSYHPSVVVPIGPSLRTADSTSESDTVSVKKKKDTVGGLELTVCAGRRESYPPALSGDIRNIGLQVGRGPAFWAASPLVSYCCSGENMQTGKNR